MKRSKVIKCLDTALWKPVEIEGGLANLDGLIGIEELVGYKVGSEKSSLEKKRKKEIAKVEEEPVIKKFKKKEKTPKKKKKKKQITGNVNAKDSDNDNENAGKFVRLRPSVCDDDSLPADAIAPVDKEDLFPWTNICVPDDLARPLVEMGFNNPTEIQRLCIPAAIKGRRDILGAAETGSGKTLAFGLPMVYGIMKNIENNSSVDIDDEGGSEFESDAEEDKDVGCVKVQNLGFDPSQFTKTDSQPLLGLVVTPTRELAVQIKQHLDAAVKYTPVKVAVIVGGLSIDKQSRILKKRPHIVVGTPGRLWELISIGDPHLSTVRFIKFLAIDETDRMIERDHYPELRSLLECINADEALAKQRQNFVFSATLTLTHEAPRYLKKKRRKTSNLTAEQKLNSLVELVGMKNYKVVDITQKSGVAHKLKESKISCTFEEKDIYLFYLISLYRERTLVFCNSISAVRRLASLLTHLGRPPLPLHANMQQRQRLKNLDKFKLSIDGVLLATDVAARGLDIPSVKNVIHYQVPRTSEGYIHRSGRTARGDQDGLTILLIEPSELKSYTRICLTLQRDKDLPEFPIDMMSLTRIKERVKLGREIDALTLQLKKQRAESGWLEKAAEDMDIIIDEDFRRRDMDSEDVARVRRALTVKRRQLDALNTKSIGRPTASAAVTLDSKKTSVKTSKPKLFKKNRQTAAK